MEIFRRQERVENLRWAAREAGLSSSGKESDEERTDSHTSRSTSHDLGGVGLDINVSVLLERSHEGSHHWRKKEGREEESKGQDGSGLNEGDVETRARNSPPGPKARVISVEKVVGMGWKGMGVERGEREVEGKRGWWFKRRKVASRKSPFSTAERTARGTQAEPTAVAGERGRGFRENGKTR